MFVDEFWLSRETLTFARRLCEVRAAIRFAYIIIIVFVIRAGHQPRDGSHARLEIIATVVLFARFVKPRVVVFMRVQRAFVFGREPPPVHAPCTPVQTFHHVHSGSGIELSELVLARCSMKRRLHAMAARTSASHAIWFLFFLRWILSMSGE